MRPDPARRAAENAAWTVLENWESNFLIRSRIWQVVNAALDAYEHELESAVSTQGARPAWCVLHPDGRPWLVVPTRRMARRQRRLLAALADEHPRMLRLVRVETIIVA